MKILLPALLVLLTPWAARAASINFDTGGSIGHMFVTIQGRLLAGSIVRLGTMEEEGNPGSFVEFGRTTISNTAGNSPYTGFLREGITIATPAEADAIKGKQIHLYVYNTTDPALLDFVNAGLFTSTEWTLPAGFDSASTTSFNIRLGGNSNIPTPPLAATAVRGFYQVGTITIESFTNQIGSIYHINIPEPGTAVLGGLAALWLAARRTRGRALPDC